MPPLDPSIALSVQPPKAPDQLGQAAQAFTLKSAMLQSQQAEQAIADQAALKTVFSDPNAFDVDPTSGVAIPKQETMQKLYAVNPAAAQKLGEATIKMRAEQTKQAEAKQKLQKGYIEQAGPALATLASEYEQLAARGDKDAAWAAVKPKVDAANQQFETLAKQAGIQFKPITDADHLIQGASQWGEYSKRQMDKGKPQSAEGKIQADLKAGLITQEQADAAMKKKDYIRPVININTGDAVPPKDSDKTGDAYLQTLKPGERNLVKKIANYDLDPKTLSTRGGHRERIMQMVSQYDAAYDDTQYANKRRAIQQFSTGTQGNTVRSLNVAIEHLDTLKRAATALNNNDLTGYNKIANEIQKYFGVAAPNTFEGLRDMVANEVVKGTIGNAGALADREEAAKKVRAAASPKQMADLFNGWTELMGGQVKGLARQYEASTKNKDFHERFLTPRTREAIKFAEDKASGGGGGDSSGGSGKGKANLVYDPATGTLKPKDRSVPE